jgi:hypothetical protein
MARGLETPGRAGLVPGRPAEHQGRAAAPMAEISERRAGMVVMVSLAGAAAAVALTRLRAIAAGSGR